MLGAPVDVGGVVVTEMLDRVGGDLHRPARLGAQIRVGAVPDGLVVVVGDAEQHADDPHGHLRAEIADEVEVPGPDQGIQTAATVFPDLRLELADLARGEHPGQQAAVDVVDGRILERDDAGAGPRNCP